MPTHIEEIKTLPSPLKEQAIKNMKRHYGSLFEYSCKYPVDSKVEALALSFPYEDTPQGKVYWKAVEDVLTLLDSGEKLKVEFGERLFNTLESWIPEKWLNVN